MNRIFVILLSSLFAISFASVTLAAPKALNHEEAEKLVKGNTAEGTNKWKNNMIWYFAENGVLRKRINNSDKGKASWSINKRGELCYQDKHMHEEKCGAIVPQGDGKYEVHLGGEWKWDKVVPGNPHNL